ncbi:mevalonate kinase [Candidatus Daviesbacteria bacterium]|nr:mevalonate kinase [Candidatus Daviesbacteria bacterium]
MHISIYEIKVKIDFLRRKLFNITNTNKVIVSAPGKLMLLGEHAVVYGRPCIVTAVGQRMKATAELIDEPIFQLDAPDVQVLDYQKPMDQLGVGYIPKGAKFVEIAVTNFLRHPQPDRGSINIDSHFRGNDRFGIKVTTKSEFSSQFGFGSSSASTVCVIKALSELTGANLDSKAIFDLAFKTVLAIQGKGSGFDVAAAVYGGTLYFVVGGKTIEPLNINYLPLIVGYSGIKADTVILINAVLEKAKKYPEVIENIYDSIGKLVEQAKQKVLSKDWQSVGELMNFNEGYLTALGVGSKKLAEMIYSSRDAGAFGAKLSGAGAGDCMIALAPEDKIPAVKDGITSAGGQVINVQANVEGVKVE